MTLYYTWMKNTSFDDEQFIMGEVYETNEEAKAKLKEHFKNTPNEMNGCFIAEIKPKEKVKVTTTYEELNTI